MALCHCIMEDVPKNLTQHLYSTVPETNRIEAVMAAHSGPTLSPFCIWSLCIHLYTVSFSHCFRNHINVIDNSLQLAALSCVVAFVLSIHYLYCSSIKGHRTWVPLQSILRLTWRRTTRSPPKVLEHRFISICCALCVRLKYQL